MMPRRSVAVLAAVLGLVPALAAQGNPAPPPASSWTRGVVHYGKWATAASAIAFTVLAAREHDDAEGYWRQLLTLCRNNNAACAQRDDGQYLDYNAELLYQRTLYYDRRARRRLIVGQLSLLASAAMFILDLRHGRDHPPNIPLGLELTAQPAGDGARVQLRVPF